MNLCTNLYCSLSQKCILHFNSMSRYKQYWLKKISMLGLCECLHKFCIVCCPRNVSCISWSVHAVVSLDHICICYKFVCMVSESCVLQPDEIRHKREVAIWKNSSERELQWSHKWDFKYYGKRSLRRRLFSVIFEISFGRWPVFHLAQDRFHSVSVCRVCVNLICY